MSIHWRYRVIRLWQVKAEALLELNSPPLTTLIGQTHIEQPAETLPSAVRQIQTVEDEFVRKNLLSLLLALVEEETLNQMVQKLVEEEQSGSQTQFGNQIG